MNQLSRERSSLIRLTYEDYLCFPDNGKRHEIIDGEHYMTPAPNIKHQQVSINLSKILLEFVQAHYLGRVFAAPCDVILSETDIVQPDLLFVPKSREGIITEDNIQGAPDLIIEILSEKTRRTDEVIKKQLYEKYGVREYWIVDPVLESVKIYERLKGRYGKAKEFSADKKTLLRSSLLKGLKIELPRIFSVPAIHG